MRRTMLFLLFLSSFLCIFFFAHEVKSDPVTPCRTFLNNGGYYFDDYEKEEYINGLLTMHLKFRPIHNDGRVWLGEFFMHNDDCSTTVFPQPGGVLMENFRPGMQFFSVRFSSETHYDFWDDEQDIKIDCQNCSGDLPQGSYTTISFEGQIDAGGSLMHSSSFSIKENPELKKKPVLIIPGILGTELDLNEETVWLNALKIVSEKDDSFMDSLNINALGQPISPDIVVGPVLPNVNYVFGKYHYSDLLVQEFVNQGYELDKNLFLFNYDWRQDVKQSASKLADKIKSILDSTGSSSIDIVAHSLGGLVAKQYLLDAGSNAHINKIIFVAVPNLGAPQAAKALIFGDSFNIPLLSSDEVQKIIQNMPSVYELLPSADYYKTSTGFYADLTKNKNILNYEDSKNFLLGLGKNKDLLNLAESLHNEQLDNINLSISGVTAFSIVGCGVFTTQTINKYYSGDPGFLKNLYNPKYRISSTTGDGTVPLISAVGINIPITNIYYAKNVQHAQMLSADGVRQLIVDLITGQNYSGNPVISQNNSNCSIQGKLVSLPSSLELAITDPMTNAPLNELNGVVQNKVGKDVFVFLPTDNNQKYNISAKPITNNISPINVEVKNYTTDKIDYYDNIKIDQQFIMNIDGTGDNAQTVDDLGAASVLQPTYSSQDPNTDTMPPVTSVQTYSGQNYKNGDNMNINIQEQRITLIAQDDNSGASSTEYSFDDGNTWQSYSSGYVLIPTSANSILFYSSDKAGNVEQTNQVTLQWIYSQDSQITSPSNIPSQNSNYNQIPNSINLESQANSPSEDIVDQEDDGVSSQSDDINGDANYDTDQNQYSGKIAQSTLEPIVIPIQGSNGQGQQPISVTINIPKEFGNQPKIETNQNTMADTLGEIYKFFSFIARLIFF